MAKHWKAEMERKCLRVSMKKTKIMVPGPNLDLLFLPSSPHVTSLSENVLLIRLHRASWPICLIAIIWCQNKTKYSKGMLI